MNYDNDLYKFNRLDWDSFYQGIEVYELILKKELVEQDFIHLMTSWVHCDLIFIKNNSFNRLNSKLISENTKAILYDTNITYHYNFLQLSSENYSFKNNYIFEIKNRIDIDINHFSEFKNSRFIKDTRIKYSFKGSIYSQWIKNSFDHNIKKFLVASSEKEIFGFLLFSFSNGQSTIELISVKQGYQNLGIASSLIYNLKLILSKEKINDLFVGTQVSNIQANNIYIKNNFRFLQSTDIYHLWK